MDDINDPFADRVMKNVPMLARFPLKRNELWTNNAPNMDVLRKHLLREGHLEKDELMEIIKKAT